MKQHWRKVQQSSMCEFLFPFRAHSPFPCCDVYCVHGEWCLCTKVLNSLHLCLQTKQANDEYLPTPLWNSVIHSQRSSFDWSSAQLLNNSSHGVDRQQLSVSNFQVWLAWQWETPWTWHLHKTAVPPPPHTHTPARTRETRDGDMAAAGHSARTAAMTHLTDAVICKD